MSPVGVSVTVLTGTSFGGSPHPYYNWLIYFSPSGGVVATSGGASNGWNAGGGPGPSFMPNNVVLPPIGVQVSVPCTAEVGSYGVTWVVPNLDYPSIPPDTAPYVSWAGTFDVIANPDPNSPTLDPYPACK